MPSARTRPRSPSLKALPPEAPAKGLAEFNANSPPALQGGGFDGATAQWSISGSGYRDKASAPRQKVRACLPRLPKNGTTTAPGTAAMSPTLVASAASTGSSIASLHSTGARSSSLGPRERSERDREDSLQARPSQGSKGSSSSKAQAPLGSPSSVSQVMSEFFLQAGCSTSKTPPGTATASAPGRSGSAAGNSKSQPLRSSSASAKNRNRSRDPAAGPSSEDPPSSLSASLSKLLASARKVDRTGSGTIAEDPAGGFIFRPAVEVPVNLVPRGSRPGTATGSRPSTGSSTTAGASAIAKSLAEAASRLRRGPSGGVDGGRGGLKSSKGDVGAGADDEAYSEQMPPSVPRIAWDDAPDNDVDGRFEGEGSSAMLEMAAKIRRELLALHLVEGDVDDIRQQQTAAAASSSSSSSGGGGGHGHRRRDRRGGDSGGTTADVGGEEQEEEGETEESEPVVEKPVVLKTKGAQESMAAVEQKLAEAGQRADSYRRQLDGYVDELRAKTFLPDDEAALAAASSAVAAAASSWSSAAAAAVEEPLIALPAPEDWEDLVDINSQMTLAWKRNQSRSQPSLHGKKGAPETASDPSASSTATPTAANSGKGAGKKAAAAPRAAQLAAERKAREARRAPAPEPEWKMPNFLEKYFSEEKGLEEIPLKALKAEEEQRLGGPSEMSHIEKGLRQIARLDELLVSRESEATKKLQKAEAEHRAAKARLDQENEEIERHKAELLEKLRQKGLLKASSSQQGAPSGRESALSTVPSTSPHSVSVVASEARVSTVASSDAGGVDWSGWACSAEDCGTAASGSTFVPTTQGPSRSESFSESSLVPASTPAPAEGEEEDDDDAEYDTSTFSLTATTAKVPEPNMDAHRGHAGGASSSSSSTKSRSKEGSTSMPASRGKVWQPQKPLASVQEEGDEGADALALAVPPDVDDEAWIYGADEATLNELSSIDERLRNLVPESEWEAKSITTSERGSILELADAASDAPSQGGRSRVRSVWSSKPSHISNASESSAPGDPTLRDQMEVRQNRDSMARVEQRLHELQLLAPPSGTGEGLSQEAMRKLLMQAAQEAPAADVSQKVLALTATSAALGGATASLQEQALVPVITLPEEEPLKLAEETLAQLALGMQTMEDEEEEAQYILEELEHEVRRLERKKQQQASSEATALNEANKDSQTDGPPAPEPGLFRSLASRVESLEADVQSLLERPGRLSEDELAKLRLLASEANNAVSAPTSEPRPPGLTSAGLPALSSAAGGEDQDDDDFEDPDLDNLSLISGVDYGLEDDEGDVEGTQSGR